MSRLAVNLVILVKKRLPIAGIMVHESRDAIAHQIGPEEVTNAPTTPTPCTPSTPRWNSDFGSVFVDGGCPGVLDVS
jgi:hypothetical protein